MTNPNNWLEKAVEQRHPNLSVLVAASLPMTCDRLDQVLVTRDSIPETKQSLQNLIKETN